MSQPLLPHLYETVILGRESPLLEGVVALHTRCRPLVEPLPAAAFAAAAARGQLLVARNSEDSPAGYLLFLLYGKTAIIRQLAVQPESRGQGLAHRLVRQLREIVSPVADGIGAWCELGGPASRIWPHLGFVPFPAVELRDFEGERLMFWWLDTTQPDIFSQVERPLSLPRRCGLLEDAVFFALAGEGKGEEESAASRAARQSAGYLNNALIHETQAFSLDPAAWKELERRLRRPGSDQDSRLRSTAALAERFERVPQAAEGDAAEKLPGLSRTLGLRGASRQKAERLLQILLNHDLQVLVTSDTNLLNRQARFYAEFGVEVLSPDDLVTRPVEVLQESAYCPARLEPRDVDLQQARNLEIGPMADRFCQMELGETRAIFGASLQRYGWEHDRTQCLVNTPEESGPHALIATVEQPGGALGVPMFRVAPHPMRATLARQLAWKLVRDAAHQGRPMVILQDGYLDDDLREILLESQFQEAGTDQLVKILVRGLWRSREVIDHLDDLAAASGFTRFVCQNHISRLRPTEAGVALQDYAETERALYPLRISNVDLPTWLVPVTPHLAARLLDPGLGSEELFEEATLPGIVPREGVFYDARPNRDYAVPGRLLWVLTGSQKNCVAAVSDLVRIESGTVEEFALRYRRLGLYDPGDIAEKNAGGKGQGLITALGFANTWLLPHPLQEIELADVLQELENRTTWTTPIRLRPETFTHIFAQSLAPRQAPLPDEDEEWE